MDVNDKYLDHIQGIITRHNSNSFMIKGWTITLSTAIFALAGAWKEPFIAIVAFVPISVFWILDSFYLANERCFVCLYNAAINKYVLKVKNKQLLLRYQIRTDPTDGNSKVDPESEIIIETSPYSMNFIAFKIIARNNWYAVIKSPTIIWFYLMLTCFSVALCISLVFFNKTVSNEPLKVTAKIGTDSLLIRTETPHTIINNIILKDSVVHRNIIKERK